MLVAKPPTDPETYGSLFDWGRGYEDVVEGWTVGDYTPKPVG